ncbi:uncharacterized protein MELLADRAFT_85764 [Melampsora larici-populina 98AG31]|uniref:Transketolase N-terminal domain-containing protein n=1 Tax=Melampsora larici-populina (strain 98AG31 / pathotype 3-4-7) TaxID=747676 RepID=F4RJP4_MELLP|nr:uncharacterized protein MELLADRAFT_85764 [Melampsora larici-populina 98AG31]EGG07457.1 hypothetical protein MELLADRAFT_85764 [Melampsora larici-populina 98AG31]
MPAFSLVEIEAKMSFFSDFLNQVKTPSVASKQIYVSKVLIQITNFDQLDFDFQIKILNQVTLHPSQPKLTQEEKSKLLNNTSILRDSIVFFTDTGAARGVGGHAGGPFDTVREVVLLLASFASGSDSKIFDHTVSDEAGHRAQSKLPGHPQLGLTPGVKFSSVVVDWATCGLFSRVSHSPTETVFCFCSDGSQHEGSDAEAARLARAQKLNIKLLIDNNNVTISGHTSGYLKGYKVGKTLEAHALKIVRAEGEKYTGCNDVKSKVIRINFDLKGSTGFEAIHQSRPGIFIPSVIVEHGNFCAAAGFGFEKGKEKMRKLDAVISFGEIVHRALDAGDQLGIEGFDVGLVNKSTLNVIDEKPWMNMDIRNLF